MTEKTRLITRRVCVATLLASLVLLFPGCPGCRRDKDDNQAGEEEEEVVITTRRTPKNVDERNFSPLSPRLKPSDAIIRVNGRDITKAEYDLFCNLQGQIYCLKRSYPLKGKRNKELDRYLKNLATKAIQALVRREQMRQAAEKAGVTASEENIKRVKMDFMMSIGRPKETFESVVKRLGPKFGPALEASILSDARDVTYLEKWSPTNLTVVTQEEIDKQKAFNIEFNKQIAEMNAASHRKAEEARKEIIEKNRLFKDVAKERAELFPEQGEHWDVVELAELEASDPFAQWLVKAEVGDISQPIDFDDGLAIVGLVSKVKSDSSIHPGEEADMYEVVRVLFKAYVPREMLETDEEWRDAILEYRRNEARRALGAELSANVQIEFPNGESIFNVKPKKKPGKAKPASNKKKGPAGKKPLKPTAKNAKPSPNAAAKPAAAPAPAPAAKPAVAPTPKPSPKPSPSPAPAAKPAAAPTPKPSPSPAPAAKPAPAPAPAPAPEKISEPKPVDSAAAPRSSK